MANWQSGEVEANGVRLHYTRTGGDHPPLVLAHSVTDDGLCWTPVATALEGEYDVIMVDARGHGRSDAPESGYDATTQAADVRGVITGLGHSMGAAPPEWRTGEDQAARTRASAVIHGRMRADEERLLGMQAWFTDLKGKTREQLIAEQPAATPSWSQAELEPWADSKLWVSSNVRTVFSPSTTQSVD